MTTEEIKKAVKSGKTVFFQNTSYQVEFDRKKNDYFIYCCFNGSKIGLTWEDGKTLNGSPKDFFVRELKKV